MISSGLKKLNKGDFIQIHGSYGSFCINIENINKKHVLNATGTGIAPFSSFIKTYPKLKYDLIHGVSYEQELYDYSYYKEGYIYGCVSREKTKNHFHGRVTDFLKSYDLSNEFVYYICGNGNMISEVYDHIISNSIEFKKYFYGVFFQ